MTAPTTKMRCHVQSGRVDAQGSLACGKNAEIALDTGESDQRMRWLHENVKGTDLSGNLRRRQGQVPHCQHPTRRAPCPRDMQKRSEPGFVTRPRTSVSA